MGNPLTYLVRGQALTAEQFKATAEKKKKAVSSNIGDGYHKGFRVIGHQAGAMESARQTNEIERNLYLSLTPERRAQSGVKEPKPWDEDSWRRHAKKQAVRSKPYELEDAANVCASLAVKAGWEDVEVVAVIKEAAE